MPLTRKDLNYLDLILANHMQQFATTLAAAINQRNAVAPGGPPEPDGIAADPNDKFCPDMESLIKATGLPRGMLQAIKRVATGHPDSPFRGRGAYPSWVRRWLAARPDFAPALRADGSH